MARQIVLDTETTGLDPEAGHRIIEIGCVELVDRKFTGNNYHQYINPEREIDEGALEVHGISTEFLQDMPLFAGIAEDFLEYIRGAELVIHNAPFDVGFLDAEFAKLNQHMRVADVATVLDTLQLARKMHPGQRNSLDALCKRYAIDNAHRQLHGALLDSEILADVYLRMTGGQTALGLSDSSGKKANADISLADITKLDRNSIGKLLTVEASEAEISAHNEVLDWLDKSAGEPCLWRK